MHDDALTRGPGGALLQIVQLLQSGIKGGRAGMGRHCERAQHAMQARQDAVVGGVACHLQRVQQSLDSLQHLAGQAGQGFWQQQGNQGRLAALGCLSHNHPLLGKRGGGGDSKKERKNLGRRINECFAALGAGKREQKEKKAAAERDERILISEVEVRGVEGELKSIAESCISIRPNFTYSLEEVKESLDRVFSSGYFEKLDPGTEDTRDGVKLVFNVTANRPLMGVVVQGANSLPQRLIEDAFREQHGETLNFGRFAASLEQIQQWYEERSLAGQVAYVGMNGDTAEIQISEMMVNSINLRFEDTKSGEVRDEGKTRPEVILREVLSQPGKIYSTKQAEKDIEAVYSMGLFSDVNITPQVCEDSTAANPKVDLNFNLVERKTGGISGGGGISATGHSEGALPGIVGSAAYSQRNLFGLNQKLNASVEIGQLDKVFRVNHTDPWIRRDAHRTSRTISLQTMKTSGAPIHGRAPDDTANAAAGQQEGNVIIARTTGGVEFGRPLATGWTGTAGLNWQRSHCQDDQGRLIQEDAYRSPLTISGGRTDSMMTALLRAVYSGPMETQLVASVEQAVPLVASWLQLNRGQGRAERTFPLPKSPFKMRLCAKGGMIIGDLPPTEAFPLGGTNSVRGYAEGGVGSARNFASGNAELRCPLFGQLEGVAFADYGTDFDSGQTVLGDPAGVRGKPGSGYGYGAGVRVDTSLGAVRLEYAWNDKGLGRFHLGIGSY